MFCDTRSFIFHGQIMDDDTGGELLRYLLAHVPTGSFLEAVIANDLHDSCARASDRDMQILPIIVAYLYNEAPTAAWGSRTRYKDWLQWGAKP